MLRLWTDGSGLASKTQPCGFGVVVEEDGVLLGYALGSRLGTNNVAELTAIVAGLDLLLRKGYGDERITIVSDSQYALGCFSKWRWAWEENGFTKDGHPIPNRDIIMRGCRLLDEFSKYPKFEWVRGHAGVHYNEVCDRLAGHARKKQLPWVAVWR